MTETKQNFTTYQGNTEACSVPITDGEGVDYVMTGAVVTWVLVRSTQGGRTPSGRTPSAPTEDDVVLTKTLTVTEHAVNFALTHADTEGLDPGTYWQEASAVFLSGDVKTLWTGWVEVLPAESAL